MTVTLKTVVTQSGEQIVLFPLDSEGNPTNVLSLASANEVQSIQLIANPTDGQFELTFNGQTTTEIPVQVSAPAINLTFPITTIAGHHYNLGATWQLLHSPSGTFQLDVIQDGVSVATFQHAGNDPPSASNGGISDSGTFLPDGTTPAYFFVANGSPIIATGTTLSLVLSGTVGGQWLQLTGVRVQDITASTITYISAIYANSIQVGAGDWFQENSSLAFMGSSLRAINGGSGLYGTDFIVSPGETTSALVLQAALQALSSIGSGNLTVTDNSNAGSGNYSCMFVGDLALSPQPMMTCGDSSIVITEVTMGGAATPKLSVSEINSGTQIPLNDQLIDENSPKPYILLPLFQSTPTVQLGIIGTLPFQGYTGDVQLFPQGSTLSGWQAFGWTSGTTIPFLFTLLKPATYEIAIFWGSEIQSAGISYEPYNAVQVLVEDGNGNPLGSSPYTVDQSVSPPSGGYVLGSFTTTQQYSSLGVTATTVGVPALSGSVQTVMTLDAVQVTRTSPDLSVVLNNGSNAVLTIEDGWATTAAGVIPGQTIDLGSLSPILPTFSAVPKTMMAGLNIEEVNGFDNFLTHSNLAQAIASAWTGATDFNGYPTTLISGSSPATCLSPILPYVFSLTDADPAVGTFRYPSGKYVLRYTGDPGFTLQTLNGSTTFIDIVETETPSNVTNNFYVFNITCNTQVNITPTFGLFISSTTLISGETYAINLSDLEIYPPDPNDPTGQTIWGLDTETNTYTSPPVLLGHPFDPQFVYKVAGMQGGRVMGICGTLLLGCSGLDDFKPTTFIERGGPSLGNAAVPVATIEAVTGESYWYAGDNPYFIFQVTTTIPHGIFNGCILNFIGCGTAEFTGATLDLTTPGNQPVIMAYPVDSTTLQCIAEFGNATTMTNVLTGGLINTPYRGSHWPIQDITLLPQIAGWRYLWFNSCITADVSEGGGAYQTALYVANNTTQDIYLECGNEVWNVQDPGLNFAFCVFQQSALTRTPPFTIELNSGHLIYYANQTAAIHAQWVAAFTSVGQQHRLFRVVGTQQGNTGVTNSILAQLQEIGAEFEVLSPASYFNGWPVSGYNQSQCPIYNGMTTNQLVEYNQLMGLYGGDAVAYVPEQFASLAQYDYSSVKIITYEGGASQLIPFDPTTIVVNGQTIANNPPASDPNYGLRLAGVRRDPGMYDTMLQRAQGMQDAGMAGWNYFDAGGLSNLYCWGQYECGTMQRGTGNPAIDTINVSDPVAAKNIGVAEIGGAWHYWASLVGQDNNKKNLLGEIMSISYFPNLSNRVIYASRSGCFLNTNLSTGGGTDDTATLNAILAKAATLGSLELVIDGPALTTGLTIYANTIIRFLPGSGLFLAANSGKPMLENANPKGGAVSAGSSSTRFGYVGGSPIDSNITICGPGYLNVNRTGGSAGGENPSQNSSGVYTPGIRITGCSGLVIEDVTIKDSPAFAMQLTNIQYFKIDVVTVLNNPITTTNTDGLHLNGPCSYGTIRGLKLTTGDDAIALNADDGHMISGSGGAYPEYITWGPITDVEVSDVTLTNCSSGIRCLSSISAIDRVTFRDFRGTISYRTLIIDVDAGEDADGGTSGTGAAGTITIDGLVVEPTSTTAGGQSAFELYGYLGCAIKRLIIRGLASTNPIAGIWLKTEALAAIDVLRIEDASIVDASDVITTPLIDVVAGSINRLEVDGLAWTGRSATGSVPAVRVSGGTVGDVSISRTWVDRLPTILALTSGTVSSIESNNVRHTNAGGTASYALASAVARFRSACSNIVLLLSGTSPTSKKTDGTEDA